MKFTERELELLSDGILQLMGNANSAARLVSTSAPSAVGTALSEYLKELRELNSRLCAAMGDDDE